MVGLDRGYGRGRKLLLLIMDLVDYLPLYTINIEEEPDQKRGKENTRKKYSKMLVFISGFMVMNLYFLTYVFSDFSPVSKINMA